MRKNKIGVAILNIVFILILVILFTVVNILPLVDRSWCSIYKSFPVSMTPVPAHCIEYFVEN